MKTGVIVLLASPLLVQARVESRTILDNIRGGNIFESFDAGNILDNGDFEAGGGSLGAWHCTNCQCSVKEFQAPWKWDWKEISWHWSKVLIFDVQFLHFSALKTNSAVITLLSLGEATSMVGLGRSPALLLSALSHFLLVYCLFSLFPGYSTLKHTLDFQCIHIMFIIDILYVRYFGWYYWNHSFQQLPGR